MPLDDLDREKLGPLVVTLDGQRAELRPATDLKWQEVAAIVDQLGPFIRFVMPKDVGISPKMLEHLRLLWIKHNGLTADDRSTRRLAGVMDKFYRSIEADFARHYPGVDPAALWRGRRWRLLLNLIDRLPQNTHYHHELMQDPEHCAAIAKWKGDHPDEDDPSPSWSVWSPEVEILTRIEDQLKILANRVVAAAGVKAPEPKFAPRPKSEMEKAIEKRRWDNHNKLTARMLPHKNPT